MESSNKPYIIPDVKLEPIKLIYKYSNSNRKTQYITYIFVGPQSKKYDSILKKIEKLSLIDALIEITEKERKTLENAYGELWPSKFYNIYHTSLFINTINENKSKKDKIIKIHGEDWLIKLITNIKNDIIFKKVNYSYGELIDLHFKIKMGKKLSKMITEADDLTDLSLESTLKKSTSNLLNINPNNFLVQDGGEYEDDIESIYSQIEDEDDLPDIESMYEDIEIVDETNESIKIEEKSLEELDMEDIEKLYQIEDYDKKSQQTASIISDILENNIIEKKTNYMVNFDDKKYNDIDNDELQNVYEKIFIYHHYINKDDSIKVIKNKICSSIKGNKHISKELFLTPSRIYLWSEYIINEKINKIMIGQKWMKKNELLKLDVEPLDISVYMDLLDIGKEIKDVLKKNTSKIKREDDDNNILYDYENYMLNDTIYMIDIYNELGVNFKATNEQIKNISETYLKLYFPKIRGEDLENIIKILDSENIVDKYKEEQKNIFDSMYNDTILEKEISDLVDDIKFNKKEEYRKIFDKGNFITQSVIHIALTILELDNNGKLRKKEEASNIIPKLDLYRIFDDFEPNINYPFVQYQIPDGQIIFKYYSEYMEEFSKSKDNIEMTTKWFENSPYGISIKVRIPSTNINENDKFMAININEIGKIEYKTQWKEEDNANMDDVINTYNYVKDLVKIINTSLINHPNKIQIREPENYEFRYAFINCIQKFSIPNDKAIDHNDLSDFCVYFYPYVSLVIEPKKRTSVKSIESDNEGKSKYGSYLRYKRISKYDNQGKIEMRILSFLKNYDYTEESIAEEISTQFNITLENAKEEIIKVKNKFPTLVASKGNKVLAKKEGEIGKYKPPGIGVDIQGKTPEKYKIRISGAREENQLERIILFMNILMYLYVEVYINKNQKYMEIKNKLKKLTKVAKRRNKVIEIVNHQKEINVIKQITQLDKKRLGFKPEEGNNQWTRACQNSGKDNRRRPQQILIDNVQKLKSKGYTLNKKTGDYEKKVTIKGKKDQVFTLKALKVSSVDDATGVKNEIFYTCDPIDNGEHMYVGFLTKSNNPFGECMPCCFKKNPLQNLNKEKISFYNNCLNTNIKDEKDIPSNKKNKKIEDINSNELYILQDTNKIQEGRIGYLPKYINLITNDMFNKKKLVKNHYLLQTDGYYFKYGVDHENYSFIKTLSAVFNMSVNEIKKRIINFLRKDSDQLYYISLNDGDIRTEYLINDFIQFIQNEEFIDYYYLYDLLKIEGLFTKNGVFPIVFNKKHTIIKSGVENDSITDDFYLTINRSMLTDKQYTRDMFKNKDILILIKEGKYYHPIVEIKKHDEFEKNILVHKLFNYENKNDSKIINNILKFFEHTTQDMINDYDFNNISAREINYIIDDIISKNKKNTQFKIKYQVVDTKFKAKYVVCENNLIIPVLSSGIINNIPIICMGREHSCFNDFDTIKNTQNKLNELYKLVDEKIKIKPIGLFYDKMLNNKKDINVIGIMTNNNDIIPIKKQVMSIKELEEQKILYLHRPLYHELDEKLEVYNHEYESIVDDRVLNINKIKYLDESYQLFKFELSHFINNNEYVEVRNEIKKYIKEKNTKKLNKIFTDFIKENNLIVILKELPELTRYTIQNKRKLCNTNDENKCSNSPHCAINEQTVNKVLTSKKRNNTECSFALTKDYLEIFIKKLCIEICENEVKAFELLKEKQYYITDIVDYKNFTERPLQKIIKNSNTNLQKILENIFGKENVPKIGKRHFNKKVQVNLQQLQLENPLKDIKNAYSQIIIPFNYSILRAYVNGFFWIKHNMYTNDNRNLGFYSDYQNDLINLFRSLIIDWINNPLNLDIIDELGDETKKILGDTIFVNNTPNKIKINKYIVSLMDSNIEQNYALLELFILNKIHKIPIVIIINGNPTWYFNDNIELLNKNNYDENVKLLNSNNICIELDFSIKEDNYPSVVEIIYFKN